MSNTNTVPMSVLIQQEIDRRKAQPYLHHAEDIQAEIDRRKAARAMQKARLRLVWVAPAQEKGNQGRTEKC